MYLPCLRILSNNRIGVKRVQTITSNLCLLKCPQCRHCKNFHLEGCSPNDKLCKCFCIAKSSRLNALHNRLANRRIKIAVISYARYNSYLFRMQLTERGLDVLKLTYCSYLQGLLLNGYPVFSARIHCATAKEIMHLIINQMVGVFFF